MKKKAFSTIVVVSLALLFSFPVWADTVLTTVFVGNEPAGVAANPRTDKIYIALDSASEIAVLNGRTNTVSKLIPLAAHPVAVGVNVFTNRVYSTSCDFSTGLCSVYVINGHKDTVITHIPLNTRPGIGLQGIGVNPVTNRIYVSDADNGLVYIIDGVSNTVIGQLAVPFPGRIAVNPKTNRIYVADPGFPGALFVFDGSTNTQIARVAVPGMEQVAANFRLNRAYVTIDSNALGVVDGKTNSLVATAPTGAFPAGVDVNLLNDKIYVADANGASVTIIDGSTNQVAQTLPIPATFPDAVSVNPVTGRAYITDFVSGNVIVLQPSENDSDENRKNDGDKNNEKNEKNRK